MLWTTCEGVCGGGGSGPAPLVLGQALLLEAHGRADRPRSFLLLLKWVLGDTPFFAHCCHSPPGPGRWPQHSLSCGVHSYPPPSRTWVFSSAADGVASVLLVVVGCFCLCSLAASGPWTHCPQERGSREDVPSTYPQGGPGVSVALLGPPDPAQPTACGADGCPAEPAPIPNTRDHE